ncbi:Maf family protein [Anaeromicrobium sediminis]|uniref:dTTP/UTP pyrophosphatase n=1 Tax=Anaeromicrobium sediminis TaxID=1478221 RepID=A0A267MR94_9FIRM|nr:Maf family protein [Anaeromicrobium sediminis]PAB61428.1 septum formation protein Maf [Anaeromicrobium sediminis]
MEKIILASNSPRRKEILGKFNIHLRIEKSSVDEKVNEGDIPEQVAMALAFQKTLDVAERCDDGGIVIGADTIVVKDHHILGKPANYDEAFNTLKKLSGTYHHVITGVAIIKANTYKKVVFYEKTKVKIKDLSDDDICNYINTNEVWDKAGSYGIQGIGSALVESIEGDYFNVVGLPIARLSSILRKDFNIKLI